MANKRIKEQGKIRDKLSESCFDLRGNCPQCIGSDKGLLQNQWDPQSGEH